MTKYEVLRDDFKKLIFSDRLSHAYLFFGGNEPDRESKFIFSWSIANFLENNVFEPPRKQLNELLLIRPNEEGNIGIDESRALKSFLYQKPIFSKKRTVLIKEGERLTPQAQSAILKIMEEPPEPALIILIVRNEDSLFGVLKSRFQKIYFPPEPIKETKPAKPDYFNLEDIVENDKVDEFFESLLARLGRDPLKNSRELKETLRRYVLLKQYNVNKKLQLRTLMALLGGGNR